MPKFTFKDGSEIYVEKVTVHWRENKKEITPYMEIHHYDGGTEKVSSLEPIFGQLYSQIFGPKPECRDQYEE